MIREQNFSASSGGPFSCWLNSFSSSVRPVNTFWKPSAAACAPDAGGPRAGGGAPPSAAAAVRSSRCAEPPAPGGGARAPSSSVQSAERLRPPESPPSAAPCVLAGAAAGAQAARGPRLRGASSRLWIRGLCVGDSDGEWLGELSCRVVVRM